jgi:tellurite methyltransferase
VSNSWNKYWKDEANRDYWARPDQAVVSLLESINKTKIVSVLDLGCGIGRHTLLLAKQGFDVTAVDSSAEALAVLKQQAREECLKVQITVGDYSQDLFPHNSFDLVLAFNVLYHGYRENFKTAINRVHSWLKPGGLFFFTCPTRQDGKYGSGEKVAADTYRPLTSIHPGDIHYFSDEADITSFTRGFSQVNTKVNEHHWDNNGADQFSSYWEVLAAK